MSVALLLYKAIVKLPPRSEWKQTLSRFTAQLKKSSLTSKYQPNSNAGNVSSGQLTGNRFVVFLSCLDPFGMPVHAPALTRHSVGSVVRLIIRVLAAFACQVAFSVSGYISSRVAVWTYTLPSKDIALNSASLVGTGSFDTMPLLPFPNLFKPTSCDIVAESAALEGIQPPLCPSGISDVALNAGLEPNDVRFMFSSGNNYAFASNSDGELEQSTLKAR